VYYTLNFAVQILLNPQKICVRNSTNRCFAGPKPKLHNELITGPPDRLRDFPPPTVYELARQKSHAKMKKCYPASAEIAERIREAEEREDRAERTAEAAERAVDE
jgi:hypothetical protein